MCRQDSRIHTWVLTILLTISLVPSAVWAQQSQGRVNVAVVDPSGAIVTGVQLVLVDLATNYTRTGITQEAGNYSFVNLNYGQYKLTISRIGFATQTYTVVVQSARDTDVKATLAIGATEQTLTVEGGLAPLVESTTNAVNITIDTKQIEDLPLAGRDVSTFATLSAGYNGAFNGMPITAQGNTMDGILANTGRWKYSGSGTGTIGAGVTPRLENIAEMTVATDQLDMNSGWGNANMQFTYVTRRGTNNWHGRFFEDHRNSALNAYGWGSTQKSKFHLNEFGGSIGGPILKDKLFFFANFSMFKQPGGSTVTRQYFRDPAKTGIFTYGNGVTVNLFDVIRAYNTSKGTTLPTSLNSLVAARIAQVDQWRTSSGAPVPTSAAPSDPNINNWQFQAQTPITRYYPTVRLDYNLSQSKRLNFAFNQTKESRPGTNPDHWAGDGRAADNSSNGFTSALGFEWSISPTLISQTKLGYMYTASWFGMNGPTDYRKPGATVIWYGYDGGGAGLNLNDYYEYPNARMQPVWSLSQNFNWAKGSHFFAFGGTAYRDQNKYWDPEEGFTQITLGLDQNDPATTALAQAALQGLSFNANGQCNSTTNKCAAMTTSELANARQLYATLTGRIGTGTNGFYGRHALDPKTGQFFTGVDRNVLNELEKSWGLFFQDSWKLKPNLTVNYGLRWDFVSPDKDLTKKYMTLTNQDIWGPTAIGALFQPGGALTGTMNPQWRTTPQAYDGWNVTPQPAIGIAWTPRADGNFMERLLGGNKTVFRAGYALRRFTEPQQYIWDFGTNYATGFYQRFYSYPGTTNGNGFFVAGSLKLGDPIPTNTFAIVPNQYQNAIPMSGSTFGSMTVNSIQKGIGQPYTQSWNFGIQRELGGSRALEVRYNGNRTIHQWIAPNINEVNIFENHFVDEFKQAMTNYSLNHAAGVESFGNRGLAGQANLPILTAAGISPTSSTYLTYVKNGQAGSAAWQLQRTKDSFCRLVGAAAFSPCAGTGYAGAGYPINFFVVNPFSSVGASELMDAGYSNYHALQVDFRQRSWHGVNANANYTWSRTLGVAATDWYVTTNQFTLRDLRSSYAPQLGDRNHVIHVSTTYDLPLGKGKQFLNMGGVVDRVLGGWTVSSIVTFQSGNAFRISGSNNTFNQVVDGGVALNGITPDQLQSRIGHYFNAAGQPYFLDPNAMTVSSGTATFTDGGSITSWSTPGTFGSVFYLHGPHQTYADVGISKAMSFTERFKFKFQTEMLNAFNHPTFGQNTSAVNNSSFGRASQTATSRRIEFRANLEF